MWIPKELWQRLNKNTDDGWKEAREERCVAAELRGENAQLKIRLQQQETLNEWFRHRLTQVEQERAQLIYAATSGKGAVPSEVKIAAPNFNGQVPVENFATMAQMLNKGFNPFEGIGENSQEAGDQIPEATVEDTSNMPRHISR